MDKRRCHHYSDDSASPSPPPTAFPDTILANYHPLNPIAPPIRHDHFSALPQELIEEIGLFACSLSTTTITPPADPDSDPETQEPLFHAERHRQHTLHTLSLVSKLFHQIFHHRLYMHPLLIDTQLAPSLQHLPHTATKWLTASCSKSSHAKTVTLWRPRSHEMSSETSGPGGVFSLRPVNPFVILYMFTNIRELTLSGNFRNTGPSTTFAAMGNGGGGGIGDSQIQNPSLMPEYVPHLTSVRLVDVDDAELLAILLVGVAHKLTHLTIHPSERGTTAGYSPRSVYNTLRPVIENLVSLSSLTVSLPSVKFGLSRIDHCTHGCKLVHKSLVPLPAKDKLHDLSIDLPLFGCRTQFDKHNNDAGAGGQADHAWYYLTLQNFLADCGHLQRLTYKGSPVPAEIMQRLTEACPSAEMTFTKAEMATQPRSTGLFNWIGPVSPPAVTNLWGEPIDPPTPTPIAPAIAAVAAATAVWRPLTDPYPEPATVDVQQFDLDRYTTEYNFTHILPPVQAMQESTSTMLPSIYEYLIPGQSAPKSYYHDPSPWQTSSSSDDVDEDEEPEDEEDEGEDEETQEEETQDGYYDGQQNGGAEYMYQEDGEYIFNPHETMHLNPQSQEWDWFVKYPDP